MRTGIPVTIAAAAALGAAQFDVHAFRIVLADGSSHQQITSEGLIKVSTKRLGPNLSFHADAIESIALANRFVDLQKYEPSDHFDNEMFEESATKIFTDRVSAILLVSNTRVARQYIGSALHTIQDFYAHSNWSNIKPRKETLNFEDKEWGTFIARIRNEVGSDPAPGSAGCDDGDSNLNSMASRLLTTAYFLKEHSYPYPPLSIGGVRKCVHGGPTTNWRGIGFEKDAVGDFLHADAKERAVLATTKFVQSIIDELESRNTLQDDIAICRLLGQREALCGGKGAVTLYQLDYFKYFSAIQKGIDVRNTNGTSESRALAEEPLIEFSLAPLTRRVANVCRVGDSEWVEKTRNEVHIWRNVPDDFGHPLQPNPAPLPECVNSIGDVTSISTTVLSWRLSNDGTLAGTRSITLNQGEETCTATDPTAIKVRWWTKRTDEDVDTFSIDLDDISGSISNTNQTISDRREWWSYGGPLVETRDHTTHSRTSMAKWGPTEPGAWLKVIRQFPFEGRDKLPAECKDEPLAPVVEEH